MTLCTTILPWLTATLLTATVKSAELIGLYNAALDKPAYQSSIFSNSYVRYAPTLANDGNLHTTATTGSSRSSRAWCSITKRDINPWWAVDLGRPTTVNRVYFTNTQANVANFIIGLTNISPIHIIPTLWNYTVCGQYPGAVLHRDTVTLYCQDNLPPFRYVIVQLPRTDHLHLCELEVMAPAPGHVLSNVAVNKRSFQVSTYGDEFGAHGPSLANDGSRQTNQLVSAYSCAQSNNAVNPWWAVDLQNKTFVVRVDLTSRGDCCGNRSNNFVVGLTNDILTAHSPALWNYTLCGQYPGAVSDGATVSVHCTNTYERRLGFRFVIVQFPTSEEPLNVCEIEVFAFDPADNSSTSQNGGNKYPTTTLSPNEHINKVESNPFIVATIAVSLLAAILIIFAVILVVILVKQRAENTQLRQQISEQGAHGEEQYDSIATGDTAVRGYEHMQMSRK